MPNRIIKETIRTSKSVSALSDFQFRLWIYLITYVDDYGRGIADPELIKGFCFPRGKDLSEEQIDKTLHELEANGMICLYEVDGDWFLCFPKWDKHQRIQTKKSKYPAPPWFTVTHGESPPESNPNQSESEYKKESESESESDARAREEMFEKFWLAYPKKVGKKAARKVFQKIDVPLETLLTAIERQKCSDQWSRDNGQYIPNPTTWLNQGRWEDEVRVSSKPVSTTTTGRQQTVTQYKGRDFFDEE